MAEPIFDASLETLLAEFSKSGVRELHLRIGDFELYLSNDETAPGWRPTSPMPPSITNDVTSASLDCG